jgi:hypothetical protein
LVSLARRAAPGIVALLVCLLVCQAAVPPPLPFSGSDSLGPPAGASIRLEVPAANTKLLGGTRPRFGFEQQDTRKTEIPAADWRDSVFVPPPLARESFLHLERVHLPYFVRFGSLTGRSPPL